jgi:cation diffusion facilitator CzcD-associated flavoprotein CzcO
MVTPMTVAPAPLGGTGADPRIVIIGAGFSGIGAAIRLLQSGQDDFIILERADQLGGTWRDNVYPGCRCDVPSNLYSYSFALNPNWSRTYADRDEIWDYLQETTDRFGVLPHIRWSHRVLDATWEDADGWSVSTDHGVFRCQYLIAATGLLAEPSTPQIEGATSFAGTIMHSARWDSTQRFESQRVAVIGTGASAIQIVPSLQPTVNHLSVFQRTPGWVVPHPVRPVRPWAKRLFGLFPPAQRVARGLTYWQREVVLVSAFTKYDGLRAFLQRGATRHLRAQISDPALRAKLTPDYQLGCKRVLPSNDFYPALTQPNVSLVTQAIDRIEPDGIVTADGQLHQVDIIVFATGFRVSDNPIAEHVTGREGHRLSEAFNGGLAAYFGTTFPHFPNFFMLTGPNTGTGHTSQIFMIESQLNYVLDALDVLGERPDTVSEVLPSVAEAFTEDLQSRVKSTVWGSGCNSWYLNQEGRNVSIWPDYSFSYRRQTRRFDPTDYVIGHRT